tara:strand:+ start:232 stop:492 length:261 start_codon:yes stop_codon:yes gene_type:complete
MPRYNYHCEVCDEYFEIKHGMLESLEICVSCESPDFRRVPSIPTYINKINKGSKKKTGSVVEEYIKKNKESISEEKRKLREKEYKS